MSKALRVAIRADASVQIGTGHLKRCLSLAHALAEAGAVPLIVTRRLDGVADGLLEGQRIRVEWLPAVPTPTKASRHASYPPHSSWAGVSGMQDAAETLAALCEWKPQWVVVDHYAFDARWHRAVRSGLRCRLVAIDDMADRPIDADVLVDHNWAPCHKQKYAKCLVREPKWLCGPRFALLAAPYRDAPRYTFALTVRSVGVFMGGTDPGGASARALAACRLGGFTGPIEVVSTTANPNLGELRHLCAADSAASLTLDANDLTGFFARHDLHVGAGGGATWERCCIGAPTVAAALAVNQIPVLEGVAALGVIEASHSLNELDGCIRRLLSDPGKRKEMHQRSIELVDGDGARRIARNLMDTQLNGTRQFPAQ